MTTAVPADRAEGSGEMPLELEIVAAGYDSDDARMLTARVQEFYVERYGGPDDDPTDPREFAPPEGGFFIGRLGGAPVAMGGFRPLGVERLGSAESAEIKRMYVVPEAQGHGLARAVLAHLEASALAAGYAVLLLSTGSLQHEAIGLYESSGYEPVEGFGFYGGMELNRCYGKRLR